MELRRPPDHGTCIPVPEGCEDLGGAVLPDPYDDYTELCTDDSCDPEGGCVHTPNFADCDDGDACSLGDTCKEGVCAAGFSWVCFQGLVALWGARSARCGADGLGTGTSARRRRYDYVLSTGREHQELLRPSLDQFPSSASRLLAGQTVPCSPI